MRWLFRPAVAFMGRLRYVQKFALVGLVLALPLGLVTKAYVEGQDHQIAVSAKEHDGIGYLAPLVQLTAKVVDARHAAVTGKGGPAGLGTEIAEVDRVDRRLGSRFDTRKRWAEARRLLARAARAAGPRQGYAAYNRAAAALLSLIVHVGDRSNLTLDPDLDSYYLMDALQFRLPLLLDTAGRAVDRAVLANRGLDPDLTGAFIEIGSGNGVIASTRAALASGIATSLGNTASASLTRLVPSSMAALDRATARLLERLTDAVKRRRLGQLEASAGEQVRTQAARFAALVAVELDWLLEARIERFSDRARQVEALAALAGLLAVYLFVGFYLAVATPVRRMVAALRAVGAGDLDQVVPVDTRDELSIIGRALNDTVALTKVATERLAHEATHDVLTGLASRKLVLDRLDQALARQERHAGLLAVLFVDLDRFKPINDSLGHDPGDEVLRAVAERLRGAVRPGDLVGRLAGDEFVVVCEDLTGTGEAVAVSDRLIELVSRPIVVEQRPGISREVEVGASVGIVVARPGRAATPDELLRDADLAMYRAKQRGRGCAEIFDDALRVAVQRRLQVQEELRQAVHHGQLRTFYQPIVAAGTGAPSGFEALVRWEHPTRGLLGPAEFIPAAEDSALIVPLGAWVLREACRQLAAWRDADPAFTRLDMSVNLSARQLSDPSLVPMVAEILDGSGLAPHLLWLEITESTILTDIEAAEQTLGALHGLGVRLAIDDFGTGYSSLAHLRRFPLEALKIDRSFVQGVSGDPDDQAIVALVANLAHALRLQVVAEGVETAEQLDELRRLGCDRLQGYYFHRPMPAGDATAYLAHSAGHAAVPAAQQPAAGLR